MLDIHHPNVRRKSPCPDAECGAFRGHHPRCKLQTVEEKARQMLVYYEAWLKIRLQLDKMRGYYSNEMTMWQGKFRIVKHENNKLRRELYAKG